MSSMPYDELISKRIQKKQQIFCDPIHGQICFNSLCLKIIDTPEFQRLRFIKQLGFAYTVYPGANNTRFEHSLGVAYLSRNFLQELRNNQPELNITDDDICCVQIAGLCHDLGHGPFSHSWERFMKKSRMARKDETPLWKHEMASIRIFDYIVEKYRLAEEFRNYGIDEAKLNFVRDIIKGRTTNDDRAFFYQIVNNEESGLDVDKWDYYLRDCHYLGIKCGFEYNRLMQFARVIKVDGRNTICFRDKVINTVYGMFRTRSELHHVAYQHRMSNRIERFICDTLIKADGNVNAPNGSTFQFYDWTNATVQNNRDNEEMMRNFCMLTDDTVYSALKYSKMEDIRNAIDIIERRFQNSKLFQTVSSWNITEEVDENVVKEDIAKCISDLPFDYIKEFNEKYKADFKLLTEDDFIIQVISIDWGKERKNPVDFVYFYSKDDMDKAFKWKEDDAKWIIPKIFRDTRLSILCNREDKIAYEILKIVCEKYKRMHSI